MFVVAAIVTPPDPVSQLSLAIPLCLLYEISVWLSVWVERDRERREREREKEQEKEDRDDNTDTKERSAVTPA